MTRPTGECEGEPCWLPADYLDLNVEIGVWETLRDQYQASLDQADQKLQELNDELMEANNNPCP